MGSDQQIVVNGIAFLTWSSHRRTTGLAAGLGIELFELLSARRGFVRHLELITRTLHLLFTRSFGVIVAQNPSIVLAMLLVCIRPLRRFRLVVDAHNEAITPFVHDVAVVRLASRWLLRHSYLTIVTNSELADRVSHAHGCPFVLPDPLPAVPPNLPTGASQPPYVAVVCTFAPDEPLAEIFRAAEGLPEVRFKVTGDTQRCPPALLAAKPANVDLTGFLDEQSYWRLLACSAAVLDLTSMPDCLVCGAYEALALGVPMILTDNAAGRRLFGQVAVFTDSAPASIAAGIRAALERGRNRALAQEYSVNWSAQLARLRSALQEISTNQKSANNRLRAKPPSFNDKRDTL